MKKLCVLFLSCIMLILPLAGCSAASKDSEGGFAYPGINLDANAGLPGENVEYPPVMDGEVDVIPGEDIQKPQVVENPFIQTEKEAISTFSADVDTASYTYFRKLVQGGYHLSELERMSADLRTEEFLNYFKYEATAPENGELFGITGTLLPCPWNQENRLLRLTLQADIIQPEGGNNLVFLVDVSGSMSSSDKLPLLKKAFSYLVSQLTENDRVSIVTYSGKEKVVLSGCPGNKGDKILKAINDLKAEGSTNGEAGLRMAYSLAKDYMIEGGNNRIIMASDGDLNVGISSAEELKTFVEEKRNQGIYLSVLGFGVGNYRDRNMEALADNGNGVYYYIDGESEAEKIFGTDLLSTLYTVAEDVKLQITFRPEAVSAYRLVGYENRRLNTEDFEDDTKDAGDVGAGHQVTVFYELKITENAAGEAEWLTLAVRHKRPGESQSNLNMYAVGAENLAERASVDEAFMMAVIECVMVLQKSQYAGDFDMENVLSQLNALDLSQHPERAEFRTLVQKLVMSDSKS